MIASCPSGVNKYHHGHYNNIKNNPKNGETDVDYVTRAFSVYSDKKKGAAFKFIRWDVVRHFSKWARVPLVGQSSSNMTKQAPLLVARMLVVKRLRRSAYQIEINGKKRAPKSHTLGADYTEDLADLNDQICTFNNIQQQRNAKKKRFSAFLNEK
ncbi:hypothetical protein Hanom_Chr04g00295451 [Helianthus anomalus]